LARFSICGMLCLALVIACGPTPSGPRDTGPKVDASPEPVGMVSAPLAEGPRGPSSLPDSPEPDAPTDPISPATRTQGGVPPEFLEVLIVQAAGELGVPVEELQIVRAEGVDWPDGAWGCPEAGMVYTRTLVPGYWVELQLGDLTLDYRADGDGRFRRCGLGGIAPPSWQPPVGGEHTESPHS